MSDAAELAKRSWETVALHTELHDFDELPEGSPRQTASHCAALADMLIEELPDSLNLTRALRRLAGAQTLAVAAAKEASAFTCPVCDAVSHHPTDKAEGYCGRCRDYTAPRS